MGRTGHLHMGPTRGPAKWPINLRYVNSVLNDGYPPRRIEFDVSSLLGNSPGDRMALTTDAWGRTKGITALGWIRKRPRRVPPLARPWLTRRVYIG